jgi:hypothetical protein
MSEQFAYRAAQQREQKQWQYEVPLLSYHARFGSTESGWARAPIYAGDEVYHGSGRLAEIGSVVSNGIGTRHW